MEKRWAGTTDFFNVVSVDDLYQVSDKFLKAIDVPKGPRPDELILNLRKKCTDFFNQ